MRTALAAYIVSMPLLHALSPLPVTAANYWIAAVALLVALAAAFAGTDNRLYFRRDDGLFGLLFLLGLVPMVLRLGSLGPQNLIYLILYPAIWFVCFWWLREWMLREAVSLEQVSRWSAGGAVFIATAILLEVLSTNTTGLYLSDYLYFSIKEFPQATLLEDAFARPRGFASEAGFSAIVFECLAPLGMFWARARLARLLAYLTVVVLGYLALFSVASISCFLLIAMVVSIRRWRWFALAAAAVLVVAITSLIAASDEASFLAYELFQRKFLEFTPDDIAVHDNSFSRPEAYELGLRVLLHHPLGLGWGTLSQLGAERAALLDTPLKGSGLISLPLEMATSAGLLGGALFVGIVLAKARRLATCGTPGARWVLMSLAWVSLHHMVVQETWLPMIWFVLALTDVVVLRAAPPVPASTKLPPTAHTGPTEAL